MMRNTDEQEQNIESYLQTDDVLLHILSFLDYNALTQTKRVSMRWNSVTNEVLYRGTLFQNEENILKRFFYQIIQNPEIMMKSVMQPTKLLLNNIIKKLYEVRKNYFSALTTLQEQINKVDRKDFNGDRLIVALEELQNAIIRKMLTQQSNENIQKTISLLCDQGLNFTNSLNMKIILQYLSSTRLNVNIGLDVINNMLNEFEKGRFVDVNLDTQIKTLKVMQRVFDVYPATQNLPIYTRFVDLLGELNRTSEARRMEMHRQDWF